MYKPTKELRELQLKCLEILDVIHEICIKHNIEYSLCGGSVIGAYLYKGIIPWDDDIDVMMTRENYNKFIKVCKRELIKPYKLMHYSTSSEVLNGFAKIVDESTTLVEPAASTDNNVSGVFVDITVYDCVPVTISPMLQRMAMCTRLLLTGLKPVSFKYKCIYVISRTLPFSIKKIVLKICELVFASFKKKQSNIWLEFWGYSPYDSHCPHYLFDNYINIEFEGNEYRVIKDFLEYLKIRYKRDNFELPDEEQKPHHIIHFDLNKPYEEYLKEIK